MCELNTWHPVLLPWSPEEGLHELIKVAVRKLCSVMKTG